MTRKKSSCEAELDILTRLPTEMSSKLVVLFPAGNSEVEKKTKTKVHSDFWFRSTSESLTAILGINGQHQSSGAAPEPLGWKHNIRMFSKSLKICFSPLSLGTKSNLFNWLNWRNIHIRNLNTHRNRDKDSCKLWKFSLPLQWLSNHSVKTAAVGKNKSTLPKNIQLRHAINWWGEKTIELFFQQERYWTLVSPG